MDKTLIVYQYSPANQQLQKRIYTVPNPPGATVLQALQYIYDQLDPSLAFRYGCRYNHCGLCGVMVDGKPRLACKVRLEHVEEVAPLPGLPLLRSLVVDRTTYMKRLLHLQLYPAGQECSPLGSLAEDSLHKNLMHCLECLCCVASCPTCAVDDSFAGPYAFVKLAQLHLDDRDNVNRQAQAAAGGIARCTECNGCVCPNGILLHEAIRSLLIIPR